VADFERVDGHPSRVQSIVKIVSIVIGQNGRDDDDGLFTSVELLRALNSLLRRSGWGVVFGTPALHFTEPLWDPVLTDPITSPSVLAAVLAGVRPLWDGAPRSTDLCPRAEIANRSQL